MNNFIEEILIILKIFYLYIIKNNFITDESKINTKKSFESKEELKNAVQNFNNKSIIKKYGDISNWDVSNITDMSWMFYISEFDRDISNWDVSNVVDMSCMFAHSKFNGDISNWNVSNITNMSWMFRNSEFNGDISNWDVSKVIYMSSMFSESKFNKDISKWDVSNATDMSNMFYDCTILEEYKPKKKTFKEKCNFINKLTKEECCISYEKININNDYMICNTCNKQYLFENINEWLKIQNTCPHCRENWTSNTIYINKV